VVNIDSPTPQHGRVTKWAVHYVKILSKFCSVVGGRLIGCSFSSTKAGRFEKGVMPTPAGIAFFKKER
jgi:hypothetical protein